MVGSTSERGATTSKSNAQLEAVIREAPVVLAMFDRDMNYIATSAPWRRMVGRTDEELIGHNHYALDPDIKEEWKDAHRRALAGEIVTSAEEAWARKDGSLQWVRYVVMPWREATTGAIGGIVISGENLTGRKLAEQALYATQAKLYAALDSMTDGVLVVDDTGRMVDVNEAFVRFNRFASKEECPRLLADYAKLIEVSHEDGSPLRADEWPIRRALGGETRTSALFRLRRTDTGASWYGSFSYAPIADAQGRISGAVVLGRDVTEDKRARDQLRESRDRYSALFAHSPFALALTKMPRGELLEVNDAFLAMFEVTREEAIGKTNVELGLADAESHDKVRALLLEQGHVRDYECIRTTRSGKPRNVLLHLDWVTIEGDKYVLTHVRDITDTKLADALARAVRIRDDVLRIVAHDLRSPLHAILIQAQLIRRAAQRGESAGIETLDRIVRASRRMNRLIEDLVEVARVEAGHPLELAKEPCAPETLVAQTVEESAPAFAESGQALKAEVESALPPVDADPTRLRQVLDNLLENARKFCAAGANVRVGARRRDGDVVFFVADEGPGIAPEALPHVFESFWQANRSDRRGAGLGLTIARSIVEAHGGRIWVESTPGRGTTFSFVVPQARA